MRSPFSTLLLAGAALLAAPAARAGLLQSATWTTTTFQGVSIVLSGTATTFAGPVEGALSGGGYSTLDGGVTSVSVSLVVSSSSAKLLDPSPAFFPFPVSYTAAISGGPVSFEFAGGAIVAQKGTIQGRVGASQVAHTNGSMQIAVPIYWHPLSIGATGSVTGYFPLLAPNYVTVDFYGWTAGTRTFTGLTSMGVPIPDVVAKGSYAISPVNPLHGVFGGAGTLTLVSPTRISIDGPLQKRTVSLTTLKLTYWSDGPYETIPIPEPGVLLLLAAGGAGLLVVRRGG